MLEQYLRLYRTDDEFRTYLFSVLGTVCTVAITLYNAYLGLTLRSAWNIFMAVYYVILIALRSLIIYTRRNSPDFSEGRARTIRSLIFLLNLSLFLPILMMIRGQSVTTVRFFPAFVMSFYMTVRIFFAVRSYHRAKKTDSILMHQLGTANLVNVLVAVLMVVNSIMMIEDGFGVVLYRDGFILFSILIWVSVLVLSYGSLEMGTGE